MTFVTFRQILRDLQRVFPRLGWVGHAGAIGSSEESGFEVAIADFPLQFGGPSGLE